MAFFSDILKISDGECAVACSVIPVLDAFGPVPGFMRLPTCGSFRFISFTFGKYKFFSPLPF